MEHGGFSMLPTMGSDSAGSPPAVTPHGHAKHEDDEWDRLPPEKRKQLAISTTAMFLGFAVLIAVVSVGNYYIQPATNYDDTDCYPTATETFFETIPLGANISIIPALEDTFDVWHRLIASANSTIDLACSEMMLTQGDSSMGGAKGGLIYAALQSAARRSVHIRIIINVPSGSTADGDALQLQKNFPHTVTVQTVNLPQLLGLGTSKVRFLIVDSTSMALGSADADWNSYAQWRELGVAVEGCPMMAVNLRKIFNTFWDSALWATVPDVWPATLKTSINNATPATVTFNHAPVPVYLTSSPPMMTAPQRTTDLDAILGIIGNARQSLAIEISDYDPLFRPQNAHIQYWADIDNAIRSVVLTRNVTVRLLVAEQSLNEGKAFLRSLAALPQVDVKQYRLAAGQLTRVNFMVSDQSAWVGSSSWTAVSLRFYGATGMVHNVGTGAGGQISLLQQVFQRDWDSMYTVPLDPVKH